MKNEMKIIAGLIMMLHRTFKPGLVIVDVKVHGELDEYWIRERKK